MKKNVSAKIFLLVCFVTLQLPGISFGAFKKLSNADWERVLREAGASPDAMLIAKCSQANTTIESIQRQTRASLTTENWIEIFKKLDIQPKDNMQCPEWAHFFETLGIDFKYDASLYVLTKTTEPVTQETAVVQSSSTIAPSYQVVDTTPSLTVPIITTAPVQQPSVIEQSSPTAARSSYQPLDAPSQATTPSLYPSSATALMQQTNVVEPLSPAEYHALTTSSSTTVPSPSSPLPTPPVHAEEYSNTSFPITQQQAQPIIPEKAYTKISLDLKGTDLFAALKIISQKTGLSIAVASNVRGSVTLYLQDIDAFAAFKMILDINDLAYVQEGNVFKVMMAQDYERVYGKKFGDRTTVDIVKLHHAKAATVERTIAPLKSKLGQIISDTATNSLILIDLPDVIIVLKKVIADLDADKETKIFALNYAVAKDAAEKIKGIITQGSGDIQVDERTNQLIVTDVPARIAEISTVIASLDRRHQEVVIQAKIIQIILGDSFKMGVNWDSIFQQVNVTKVSGEVTGNLNVFGKTDPAVRVNVGTLADNNFTVMYDLLQTVGKTDIISSPKIATIENKEARILVGKKEAYVTTTVTTPSVGTSAVAEAVTFIDVGIKLYVTPVISEDGFITMKIRPEVSSVDGTLKTSQKNEIPIVRTSESETNVMVKDGVTIVIAGLMEERKEKSVSGVPYLCKIPLLGVLFRQTTDAIVKTELAVFLTPHIITGDEENFTPQEKKIENR